MSNRLDLSPDALEAHWHRATRRGRNLAKEFGVNPGQYSKRVKRIRKLTERTASARKDRNAAGRLGDMARVGSLSDDIAALSQERERQIRKLARNVSENLSRGGFRASISVGQVIAGATTYQLEGAKPESFFVSQAVLSALRSTFRVQSLSRDAAVRLVHLALSERLPKTVIRADISKCFESISHDRLLRLLRSGPSVPALVITYVVDLLRNYAILTGQAPESAVGLPRGIPVSSYLAEIYLYRVEADIADSFQHSLVVRYVDDFFVVVPEANRTKGLVLERFEKVQSIVRSHDLELSPDLKKNFASLLEKQPAKAARFNFLGYEFVYKVNCVEVRISRSRAARLWERLGAALDAYARSDPMNGRAQKLLYRRIRFLTSNIRLANSKRGAYVGVYYSSKHATSVDRFLAIDRMLRYRVATSAAPVALRDRLLSLSLHDGFHHKRFATFDLSQMKELKSVWSS